MKVLSLLETKGRPVYTITSDHTLDDAVALMAEGNVSALIVVENEKPSGIFTDRDLYRYYQSDRNPTPHAVKIKTVISHKLITAEASDDIGDLIVLMLKTDFRHLPVVEKQSIVGMLMLNDLLECQLTALNKEIHQLKDYIDDMHDAGRD